MRKITLYWEKTSIAGQASLVRIKQHLTTSSPKLLENR